MKDGMDEICANYGNENISYSKFTSKTKLKSDITLTKECPRSKAELFAAVGRDVVRCGVFQEECIEFFVVGAPSTPVFEFYREEDICQFFQSSPKARKFALEKGWIEEEAKPKKPDLVLERMSQGWVVKDRSLPHANRVFYFSDGGSVELLGAQHSDSIWLKNKGKKL